MRRRLAVTAVVVTTLVGEWLGHGITYYRAAGIAGLQAGLGSALWQRPPPASSPA